MLEVEFAACVPGTYTAGAPLAAIAGGTFNLRLRLSPARKVASTAPFCIGVLPGYENRRLMAKLTVGYRFDPAVPQVTVCAPEYASADGMVLVTYPEGTSERCRERPFGGGYFDDDHFGNRHWNYPSPLLPEFDLFLQKVVEEAARAFIAALKQIPGLHVRVRQPPPKLSAKLHAALTTVVVDNKSMGLFDPTMDYGKSFRVVTIESTFGGTHTFPKNGAFANVIDSTDDWHVKDFDSWIALWEVKCNGGVATKTCTSDGFPATRTCSKSLVGGHIIEGKTASKMPDGSDDVYILPICKGHNNDDNNYMKAINHQEAVWLNNYNQRLTGGAVGAPRPPQSMCLRPTRR